MSEIITFISSVGGSALLTAGLVFLARNWISERIKNAIKHEYDAKLETHKAQLKCENDKEIEQLKAQLRIDATERSIRYFRVFERTTDVIATTYAKLLACKTAVENYTRSIERSDDLPIAKRLEIVQEKMDCFDEYYQSHKFYIPKNTSHKIDVIYAKLNSLTLDFIHSVENQQGRSNGPNREAWAEIVKQVNTDVPNLLMLLQEDFQWILGLSGWKPKDEVKQSGSESQ